MFAHAKFHTLAELFNFRLTSTMKCLLSLVALVSLFPLAICAGETEDRAELKTTEERMSALLARNDIDALLLHLSPDWKLVVSDGTLLTREQLSGIMKSGKLQFTADSVEEMDIRLYTDVAVVVGITRSKGSWEGNEFSGRDRFTDVFIRKEGKWLCVSSHSSELAEGQ
jgi:ketosteroid isomerase-like protein